MVGLKAVIITPVARPEGGPSFFSGGFPLYIDKKRQSQDPALKKIIEGCNNTLSKQVHFLQSWIEVFLKRSENPSTARFCNY
jgi:hypothetical protein